MAGKMVVLAFEGEHTAEGMLDNFMDMKERGVLQLDDAVIVSRAAATTKVEIDQTRFRRGRATAAAGGVGFLAGFLVGGPIVGLTAGVLWGALRDKGVDDGFVSQVSSKLGPDSSGLFLLVSGGDADKVLAELRPFKATVITTELDPAVEKRLRDALSHEE